MKCKVFLQSEDQLKQLTESGIQVLSESTTHAIVEISANQMSELKSKGYKVLQEMSEED